MAVVLIQEQPEMFRPEMYDSVNAKMGMENDPPEGLIAHTLGQGDDGKWRIVDIWESRDAHDRFAEERLRPAIEEAMREAGMDPGQMPDLQQTIYEARNLFEPAASGAR